MPFEAKYKGRCPRCGQSWLPGTRIRKLSKPLNGDIYVHVMCPAYQTVTKTRQGTAWSGTATNRRPQRSFTIAAASADCVLCAKKVHPGSQIINFSDGVAHWTCVVT